MKKYILLMSILTITYFLLFFNDNKSTPNPVDRKVVHTELELLNTNSNMEFKDVPPRTSSFPDEIEQFIGMLQQDMNMNDFHSKYFEISNLYEKQRDSSDLILKQIGEYIKDIENNQIQVESLVRKCLYLEKRLSKNFDDINNKSINEGVFNQYLFDQGLKETGFCDKIGTKGDPFWDFVRLARDGNKLAQFLMIDRVFDAAENDLRKVINIKKRPLEYMNLRDEAINYLRVLANKGVYQASKKLGEFYSKNSWSLIPYNNLLAYYYTYLAEKQSPLFDGNTDFLYSLLSDIEKVKANRMIKYL